jgi:hypothetical protein
VGTAGYIVFDNQMITYDESEGAVGYTFEVTDNNTISVTEFEPDETGTLVPGETAPFIRTAGSPVNREDKPFALNHPYLGTWRFEGDLDDGSHVLVEYRMNADGTYDVVQKMGDAEYSYTAYYFVFDHALVVYVEGEGFSTAVITDVDDDHITVSDGDETGYLTRVS